MVGLLLTKIANWTRMDVMMKSEQIKNRVYLAQTYLEKAERLLSLAFDNDAFAFETAEKIGELQDSIDDYLMETCIPLEIMEQA